jgi:hypothetical protein
MAISSAADLWDGISMPCFNYCLGVATVADETAAIERAKSWAKSFDRLPPDLLLRVTINGTPRLFRLDALGC